MRTIVHLGQAASCLTLAFISVALSYTQERSTTGGKAVVSVAPTVYVSTDGPSHPYVETTSAVNPRDAKNILAASGVFNESRVFDQLTDGVAVYSSYDRGETWIRGKFPGGDWTAEGLDPALLFDSQGIAYFAFLSHKLHGLALSRSTDGGKNWERPVVLPGEGWDREYLAEDVSGSHKGRIYVAGTLRLGRPGKRGVGAIAVIHSMDGGRTFSNPILQYNFREDERVLAISGIAVTPEGQIVIPYETVPLSREPGERFVKSNIWSITSADGGNSFSKPVLVAPTAYCWPTEPNCLRSFSLSSVAAPTNDDSPSGHQYLAWTSYTGTGHSVYLSRSKDAGHTWSQPVTVNDNEKPADHVNAAVAVNGKGIVAVSWYDRRNDPHDTCHELFLAPSLDGGESFLPNIQASDHLTCPNSSANWVAYGLSFPWTNRPDSPDGKPVQVVDISVLAQRFANAGDTHGMVADADGVFHVAWINGPNGTMQLYSTSFSVNAANGPDTHQSLGDDVTALVALEISSVIVDAHRPALSIRARVVNTGKTPIKGPFTVVLEKLQIDLKGLHPVNSDNQKLSIGAAWQFAVRQDGPDELKPNERSEAKMLQFEFEGRVPQLPDVPSRISFRVFAKR